MYDVIVIGAGPAGMMASIKAAQSKCKVLLIEKNSIAGRKLELTGGTRCNLTNLKTNDNFIREIPVNNKFLYSTLNQFGPHDIYNYFINSGIYLKIEDNDRVFPVSNKSQTIIDFLYKQVVVNNVDIHLNEYVKELVNKSDKEVITNLGVYKSKKIIIATGGKSYPITGSTGDGYEFCKELKQPITKLYPADTFLITKKALPLSGVTIENVNIKLDKETTNGSLLFTHIGLSGPSVFKISEKVYHKLKEKKEVILNIDFIPEYSNQELITALNKYELKKEVSSFFKTYLPKSLINYIFDENILKKNIDSLNKVEKEKIVNKVKNYEIEVNNTGSIEKSFVTGGGVDLKYINPKTMESTTNPGIYFVGELLDIHGHTGGYNITIALSTGFTAGSSINKE